MDQLIEKYRLLLPSVPAGFVRGLYHQINWDSRALLIEGARGTGKSTLLLQRIKRDLPKEEALYLTLDDLYFRTHTLTEVVEQFARLGGRSFFLDEVHKYPRWQQELKNLYDFHPDLKFVVSGSSILALQQSEVDLSRRVLRYTLPELSFREYLALKEGVELPKLLLEDLLSDHLTLAEGILAQIPTPLKAFKKYLQLGAYPFFLEGEVDYPMRLHQLINLIIDYDLPEARQLETQTQDKLKQLLYILSTSVPFKPNIAKLARQLHTSRSRILDMLHILEKAQLIHTLRSATMGTSLLNKPDKLYLHNTNLITALAEGQPNTGNLRETFFLSALRNAEYRVTYPKSGDFEVDHKYLFEVGGKDKSAQQVSHAPNSYVAADDIVIGIGRKIPLWLFGFLY